MAAKTALITGITGQDGYYLAGLLLSKGYEVHGITRSPPTGSRERCHYHHATLEDAEAIAGIVAEVRPDECYHLAAQTFIGAGLPDEFKTFQVNATGAHHVLAAVKEH
ncbi:MAG: GDP-mannose 4,6-dehydratase, partial [Bryobacteraceae bacterium]